MVLGTAAYMSPEQVRAHPVDHRSDIFSFGLVLYEMLSGQQAFKADSAVETMSAILKADPPRLTETRRDLPPDLDRIILHCLEKNPEERFQSAGDIAFNLESIGQSSSSGDGDRAAGDDTIALDGSGSGRSGSSRGRGPVLSPGARRCRHAPEPQFDQLTFRRGSIQAARFAPDGRTVVYAANWEGTPMTLYTAQPGNPESRSLEVQANLCAVSRTGELAILLQPAGRRRRARPDAARRRRAARGTRRRPRGALEPEWRRARRRSHVVDGRQRLEYPIGRVLYEPSGWMSSISISPSGDRIAFAEHPIPVDNRGDVAIVDTSGKKTTLSAGWEDLGQTAWSPDGREIWFSGSKQGHRPLHVRGDTLGARRASCLTGAGSLNLQDVAPDGRVIVSNGGRRLSMIVRAPGATEEKDLAWMDYSWPSRSLRRRTAASLQRAGGRRRARIRGLPSRHRRVSRPSASARVTSHSLSHDGRWAIATDLSTHTLMLLPTGTGQPRAIPSHGITAYSWAGFFPGDKRIVFAGTDKDGGTRDATCRTSTAAHRGRSPRTASRPRATPSHRTASGWRRVIRVSLRLFPVDGGEPKTVPGTEARGSADPMERATARLLYVRNGRMPARSLCDRRRVRQTNTAPRARAAEIASARQVSRRSA